MGRQQYLERLALGRSPFEDVETDAKSQDDERPKDENGVSTGYLHLGGHEQQYDDKGRPINPSTEERNQAMRNAQNSVLELVGVVESRDISDKSSEMKYRYIREAREEVLRVEHDFGEDLELMTKIFLAALSWWPETLIRRIQCGIYPSSVSFADIVLKELRTVKAGGFKGLLDTLFPAVPACLLCAVIETLLCGAVGEGVGRLQNGLIRRRFRRRTTKRINFGITVVCEALVIGIDVLLLPLHYYASVQRLGLAPSWPLLPSWRSFVPSNPSSVHSFIWTSAIGILAFRTICSPAVLLLVHNYLKRDQDEETPIASQFTRFVYPQINEPASNNTRFDLVRDPFGKILLRGYLLRTRIMRWFGWKVEYVSEYPRSGQIYENNHIPGSTSVTNGQGGQDTSDGEDDGQLHVYRSTSMSQHPAKYLAGRMDELFAKLLMLPFESLLLRAVAQSYLTSPLPKTQRAVAAAPLLYSPLGGGLLGQMRAEAGWNDTGSYLSKLGLGLALQCTTEIGVFFLVYRLTRWQGMRHYDWGNSEISIPGRMGSIIYRSPNERR